MVVKKTKRMCGIAVPWNEVRPSSRASLSKHLQLLRKKQGPLELIQLGVLVCGRISAKYLHNEENLYLK